MSVRSSTGLDAASSFAGCDPHTIVFRVFASTPAGGEGIGGTPALQFTVLDIFADGTMGMPAAPPTAPPTAPPAMLPATGAIEAIGAMGAIEVAGAVGVMGAIGAMEVADDIAGMVGAGVEEAEGEETAPSGAGLAPAGDCDGWDGVWGSTFMPHRMAATVRSISLMAGLASVAFGSGTFTVEGSTGFVAAGTVGFGTRHGCCTGCAGSFMAGLTWGWVYCIVIAGYWATE